jgi:hypothetical protein
MPRGIDLYNGLIFNAFRRKIDFRETKFMRFFGHFMPMISNGIFFTMSGQENATIAGARIEDLGAFWIFL